MKWLVYGSNGWIGDQVVKLLVDEYVIAGQARVDNSVNVEQEIITHQPDRILSLIGRTSGPGYNTIDYLEQPGKLSENIRDNLYSALCLAGLAKKHGIHMTYLGTGCIFNGYIGYTEDDDPNFFGSSYSTVKGYTDRLMRQFYSDTVLNVRIRMPIIDEHHPRNFITKIMEYEKICSTPNSMTVLPELLPIMIDMARKGTTGTINLTNPGVITHNEILSMVKEHLDPDFTWVNFTQDEQRAILSADRSNNKLNTDKLTKMYPEVQEIHDAVENIIKKMKKINHTNTLYQL
jgi:3,5-epimerase/4-reductase